MLENLGKLERIEDLRTVWENEARDFTPWLKDNINQLADVLGLDIQSVESEAPVGDFSVDLVGEEPGSARPVVIENQLERTNHDHLGKLLTYSAGKSGSVIIWIAKEIRPEHRQALDWLNTATQGNIDFFGVEIELIKIGNSPIAPHFKPVVLPKNLVPSSSASGRRPSEIGQLYRVFFQDLLEKIKRTRPGVTRATRATYQNWLVTPSGKSGFSFNLGFFWRGNDRGFNIEVYIDSGDNERNKRFFDSLSDSSEGIEQELGATLSWQRLEHARACRVALIWEKPVNVTDPPETLEELKVWAHDSYFRFRDVMAPYLENLPSGFEPNDLP